MFYFGPVHWRFPEGLTEDRHNQLTAISRRCLGVLDNRAKIGNVPQLKATYHLDDGTIVYVAKQGVIYVAEIYNLEELTSDSQTLPHFLPFLASNIINDAFETTLSPGLDWSWITSSADGGNIDWRGPNDERDLLSWNGPPGRHVFSRELDALTAPLSKFQGAIFKSGGLDISPAGITVMGAARPSNSNDGIVVGHDAENNVGLYVLPTGETVWVKVEDFPTIRPTAVIAFNKTGQKARGISWYTGGSNQSVSQGLQHEILITGSGASTSASLSDAVLGIDDYQEASGVINKKKPVGGMADPFGEDEDSTDWIAFGLWGYETQAPSFNRFITATGIKTEVVTVVGSTTTIQISSSYSGSTQFSETFETTNPHVTITGNFSASMNYTSDYSTTIVRDSFSGSIISITRSGSASGSLSVAGSIDGRAVSVYSGNSSTSMASGVTVTSISESAEMLDYTTSAGGTQKVTVSSNYTGTSYDGDILSNPPPDTASGSQSYGLSVGGLTELDDYYPSTTNFVGFSDISNSFTGIDTTGSGSNNSSSINIQVQVPWVFASGSSIRRDFQNDWASDVEPNPFWARRPICLAANLHTYPSIAVKLFSPSIRVKHSATFEYELGDGPASVEHPIAMDYNSSGNEVETVAAITFEGNNATNAADTDWDSYAVDALPNISGNKWWERDYGAVPLLGMFNWFQEKKETTFSGLRDTDTTVQLKDAAGIFYTGRETLRTTSNSALRTIEYEFDEPFNVIDWNPSDPDTTQLSNNLDIFPGATTGTHDNSQLALLFIDPRTSTAVFSESVDGSPDGRERVTVRVNGSTVSQFTVDDLSLSELVGVSQYIALIRGGSFDVVFTPFERNPEKTQSAFADRIIFGNVYLSYFFRFDSDNSEFAKSEIASTVFTEDQFALAGVSQTVNDPIITAIGVF